MAIANIDFDSGASLAALGFVDIASQDNVAGVGRFGGYGMQNVPANTGVLGDASIHFLADNPALCATFDWQRETVDSGDYILFEVMSGHVSPTSAGTLAPLSIEVLGTTLRTNTSLTTPVDTVPNFWPALGAPWVTVKVEMRMSTYNAAFATQPNGILRIWLGTNVADLVLRYERTDLLIEDFRVNFQATTDTPYCGLHWSSHGVIDNIYATDSLCSQQPNPPGGTCCGTTGPTGSDPNRLPDDRTDTPRVIPPGGAPPAYVACSTGGTPSTAADPTDAQTLTGAITPLVHVQLSLPDATVLRYGEQAFTSGNGSAVTARVLSWGSVSQTLADQSGSFDPMRTAVRLSDTDGVLRGHLASPTNRHIDGREATFFIESRANAALSVAPRVLTRGVITNWRTTNNLDVQIDVVDPLGYRYSSVSLDRPIPQRTFRRELFPECPEHLVGQAIPIIYGEYSDDYTWSIDAARIPGGITPVFYVGPAVSIPGLEGLPENHWHAHVVCSHAIAGVQSWFASNVHPAGAASVRMDPGTAGVDFLIPGYAGWSARFATNYIPITGTDGITEWFTMIFSRGPRGDAARDGEVPITLNICALEDVGDSTGDVITDMAYQLQHFLQHFVLQNYLAGTWGAVPAFPGGTPKVRTTSFDAAKAIHDIRVTGGYKGAFYIGTQRTGRQHLSEFQIGTDIRLGVNHQGQIIAKTFDEGASTAGLTAFTATAHLEESQFDVDPKLDAIVNVRSAEFGYEAGTGRVAGPKFTFRSADSIAAHGERIAAVVEMIPTRVAVVAWDMTVRKLIRGDRPVALVRCRVDLRGVDLAIGQLIDLTDFRGIGSTGWTNHVVMVTKITTLPNSDDFLCEIEAEDVHDLLAGTMMAMDAGQLDVATIG